MIDHSILEHLLQQFNKCLNLENVCLWAVRDNKSCYLAASRDYTNMMVKDKPLEIASLAIDEISKASILYCDSQLFKYRKKQTSLQALILRDKFELLKVTRYPICSETDSLPLALGVVIHQITNPIELKSLKFDRFSQPDNFRHGLKNRDLLIGMLLLDNWSLKDIAANLQISYSRLCDILFRICRRNFEVNGGGAKFRELFIKHALYKKIPLDILQTYLTLHLEYHSLR